MSKANLAVKLDPAVRDRLVALGEVMDRTPHWIMCEAIAEYLDRHEQSEKEIALARERLAKYDASGEHVDVKEAVAWLRSLGTARPLPAPPVRKRRGG